MPPVAVVATPAAVFQLVDAHGDHHGGRQAAVGRQSACGEGVAAQRGQCIVVALGRRPWVRGVPVGDGAAQGGEGGVDQGSGGRVE